MQRHIFSNDVLSTMDDCSVTGFEAAMDGVEYIIPNPSFSDCTFYNCIYNSIVSSDISFICEFVTPIFDSDDFVLNLSTGNLGYGVGGDTFYDINSGQVILTMDNLPCENLQLNETLYTARFLHEFVHAKWMMDLVKAGYNPNEINGYEKFWPNYADWLRTIYNQGSAEYVQHNIMLHIEDSIRDIAKGLYDIYNGEENNLSEEHFMMIAANGLLSLMELFPAPEGSSFLTLRGAF